MSQSSYLIINTGCLTSKQTEIFLHNFHVSVDIVTKISADLYCFTSNKSSSRLALKFDNCLISDMHAQSPHCETSNVKAQQCLNPNDSPPPSPPNI